MGQRLRRTGAIRTGIVLGSVALLTLGSCTDTTGGSLPGQPAGQDGPSVPARSPSDPARSPSGPESPPPDVAGELSLETFPKPADLGPEWALTTDPADPADIHLVNGRAAAARDVDELIKSSLPQSCPLQHPIPIPRTALEVRYTFNGEPVTAFELDFNGSAVAGAFFAVRQTDLQECKGELGPDGETLIGQVIRLEPGVTLSDRWPDLTHRRRTELSILKQSSVVLLQSNRRLGDEPFSSRRSLQMAARFRAMDR